MGLLPKPLMGFGGCFFCLLVSEGFVVGFEILEEKNHNCRQDSQTTRQIHSLLIVTLPISKLSHTPSFRRTNVIATMCCRICNYSSTAKTSQAPLKRSPLCRTTPRSALHTLLLPLRGPGVRSFVSQCCYASLTHRTSQPFKNSV